MLDQQTTPPSDNVNISRSLMWGIASLASAVISFFTGILSVFVAGFALYAGLKARKLGVMQKDNAAVICGTIGLIVSVIVLALAALGIIILLLTAMGFIGIMGLPLMWR